MILGRRRSLVLGTMWMLAGAAWLTSAIILWVDRAQVTWWELPAAAGCLWVGSLITRQRVVVDRHGLETVTARGPERLLWASIASVEISDTWMRPALQVRRKGGEEPRSIPVTSGLRGSQRVALFDTLVDLGREHGFDVLRDGHVVVTGGRDVDRGDQQAAVAGPPVGDADQAQAGANGHGDGPEEADHEHEAAAGPAPADQVPVSAGDPSEVPLAAPDAVATTPARPADDGAAPGRSRQDAAATDAIDEPTGDIEAIRDDESTQDLDEASAGDAGDGTAAGDRPTAVVEDDIAGARHEGRGEPLFGATAGPREDGLGAGDEPADVGAGDHADDGAHDAADDGTHDGTDDHADPGPVEHPA